MNQAMKRSAMFDVATTGSSAFCGYSRTCCNRVLTLSKLPIRPGLAFSVGHVNLDIVNVDDVNHAIKSTDRGR